MTLSQCAGILAAKKVDELIPLCHPLPLEHISISFKLEKDGIIIIARCKTRSKTGVEMEAMAACSVAALAIYDMCKSIDRGAVIEEITQIGKVCVSRCAIYYKTGDCIMPKEGIFARVLKGGIIKVGDRLEVIKDV